MQLYIGGLKKNNSEIFSSDIFQMPLTKSNFTVIQINQFQKKGKKRELRFFTRGFLLRRFFAIGAVSANRGMQWFLRRLRQ